MEGVVVTARKAGAKLAISVISDAQGHYSFPADRLEPGQYSLTIRAVGYDLNGKPTADVAADKTATVDLKLDKTKKLASQLTNAEWMMSMPGQRGAEGLPPELHRAATRSSASCARPTTPRSGCTSSPA